MNKRKYKDNAARQKAYRQRLAKANRARRKRLTQLEKAAKRCARRLCIENVYGLQNTSFPQARDRYTLVTGVLSSTWKYGW